jgi:hypothetical protein
MLSIFSLVAAALLPCCQAPRPNAQDLDSADFLWLQIAGRLSAIRNYEVAGTVHQKSRDLVRNGPFKRRTQSFKLTADAEGRSRAELITEGPSIRDPRKRQSLVQLVSWDGKRFRKVERLPDGKSNVPGGPGQVCEIDKLNKVPWLVRPEEILYLGDLSIPAMWREFLPSRVEVGGHEKVGGHDAIRFGGETPPNASGFSNRWVYWLAPQLGYLPILHERFLKSESHPEWKLDLRIEYADFVEAGGIWLPTKLTDTQYTSYDDGSNELAQEVVVTLEDWKLNQQLPANTFHIQFPDKTIVTDRVRGVSYLKGRIRDDPEIKDAVNKAASLTLPTEDLQARLDRALRSTPLVGEPWPFWAGAVTAVTGALGIAALIWRTLRARRIGR